MAKPNLFTYATSELSQDAMICWLLEWAKPENKNLDNQLHNMAITFMNSLFDKFDNIERPTDYHTIEIKKQYNNIDIVCIVNNRYVLLLEDKTNTKNHSNQLERYLTNTQEEFTQKVVLPIYFKTGDQSNYNNVVKHGYKVYLRQDFLKVLRLDCDSDILIDYKNYLQSIENKVNSYTTIPIEQWSSHAVKGFYMALQVALKDGNWDYVANPSGGFLGYWWNNNQLAGYKIYMQIDASKKIDGMMQLKFKLASGTKEKVEKKIIHYWKKHILYTDNEFVIKKPKVVRAGRWTTIGLLDDFWVLDSEEKIDINKTVINLKIIEELLQVKIKTTF